MRLLAAACLAMAIPTAGAIAGGSTREAAVANAIATATSEAKATVNTDPAAALPRLAAIEAKTAEIVDVRARTLARAAIARLQADAHLRLGHTNLAEPLLARAIISVRRLAPTSAVLPDLLLSRGGLNVERARVSDALSDFHHAYELFGKLNDQRSQAKALLSICYLYFEAKDYASVIRYADQAEDVFGSDPMILMSVYNNRALAMYELGRYQEAEAQFVAALTTAKKINSAVLEAQVLRNLARTRVLAGKLGEAARTIQAARRIARTDEESAEARAADALAAQIAFKQGRPAEAERLIRQSFSGIDLSETKLSSREAHDTAYQIFAVRHETGLALLHLRALKRLDDQATKLATTTSAALAKARFDFAGQELKIANLQRDEARRNVAFERARAEAQRTLFLGGAGAVAAIIVLLLAGLFTIRRSRDEVRAAAADLRVSNAALGKALAAKTEFLAATSHEIRTPLNGILGMTQVILADQAADAAIRDRIEVIHAAGTTMRALVDDILDVAKMETGNLTVEEIAFDPQATLREAALLWEDQATARGIGFAVDLGGCPTAMIGDPARVRQVVFNLLSNALKFTRSGAVTLRADRTGDAVAIAVSDTGIGIPAAKLEEIFESFRQADAGTTREFGGTGLGLSICRSLAEAMGGTITVVSEVGRGSTFTVTLPCRQPDTTAKTARERGSAMLIVERNPIARAMLKTLFQARIDVHAVASGAEALAWLASNDPRGVVADAGSIDHREQAVLGSARAGGALILLCPDPVAAVQRRTAGWRTVIRPIAGDRLVRQFFDEGVISSSDTLAAQAA